MKSPRKQKDRQPVSYAQQLQDRKREEIAAAMQEGMDLAGSLYAVALNNLYGFGAQRLAEVEKEAQRLWDEEFMADIETASYGLARRLEQIRRERPGAGKVQNL